MREFQKEDSYKNLERVNFWIANCDTKASFILALIGIFLSAFMSNDLINGSVKSLFNEISKFKPIDIKVIFIFSIIVTSGVTIFFFVRCIFNLLKTLTGKIDSPIPQEQNLSADSFLFFGSISSRGFDSYKNGWDNLSENEIVNDIDSQTYINSKICSLKFRNYNKAIGNIRLAVILFTTTIILLSVYSIVFQ
ncbi:MAG: hypothetical protein WA131_07105 [Desulfitobacteriaceae bacterium]